MTSRRRDVSKNLATWERVLSTGAGTALLVLAGRNGRNRLSLAATGAGLIARGVSGYCPVSAALSRDRNTREALSGPRGIHVREAITIARSASEIYAVWRTFSNLPTFMRHVERVDMLPDGRTHWVVAGPAGSRLEWDARLINDIPNELIAWQSIESPDVVSAGSVRFSPARRGSTTVRVHLQYSPPGGKVGSWVATFLGSNPASQIRADLRRFKGLLESGELSAPAQAARADDAAGERVTPIPAF
jgi:uncharacterized membrane protein